MTRRRKAKSRSYCEAEGSKVSRVVEIEDVSCHHDHIFSDKQLTYLTHNPEVFTWNFDDNDRAANIFHVLAKTGKSDMLLELLELEPPSLSLNQPDLESRFAPLHDAIYYGNIRAAVLLIKAGASLSSIDHDGFNPLDVAVWSQFKNGFVTSKSRLNVVTWGSNSNYNLGHAHDASVKIPEKVKTFNRNKFKASIVNVNFGKYHTLFLDSQGDVYSCGFGPGGRLGLGSEDTELAPVKIPDLKNVIKISCSNDHSLVLTREGHVYSWGINTHKVLGHGDLSKTYNKPRQIASVGGLDSIITVKAAKYHSVLVASDQIYTFGFNGGQIGHIYSEEPYQVAPRSVTRLRHIPGVENSRIAHVHASAAATVVGFENGIICICNQYEVRKVASLSVTGVMAHPSLNHMVKTQKIRVTGGKLSREVRENVHRPTKDILIVILDTNGLVYVCWPNKFKNALLYSWNVFSHKFVVRDVTLGSNTLMLLTTDGEVYTCNPYPQLKSEKEVKRDHSSKTWSSIGNRKRDTPQITKPTKLQKQGALHSGVKVVCSSTGYERACIVEDRVSVNDIRPKIEESTFMSDVSQLYDNDAVYETDLVVYDDSGRKYNAHKAIVANASEKLFSIVQHATSNDSSSIQIKGSSSKGGGMAKRVLETLYFISELPELKAQVKVGKVPVLLNGLVDPVRYRAISREDVLMYSDVSLVSNDGTRLKCHRCVLAGRNEYFMTHFMVNSRWGSSQLNSEILVDTTKQGLQDFVYYLYTDKFPKTTNLEGLQTLLRVSDVYLSSRLKSFCEAQLVEYVTEENVLHMLNFSHQFNAFQLKEVCLNIIAMNIPFYLEFRHLENIDADLLEQLSIVYKQIVLFHMKVPKFTEELEALHQFIQNIGMRESTLSPRGLTKPRSHSNAKIPPDVGFTPGKPTQTITITKANESSKEAVEVELSRGKQSNSTTPGGWGDAVVTNGASTHDTFLSLTEIMRQEEALKNSNRQATRPRSSITPNKSSEKPKPKVNSSQPWGARNDDPILDLRSIMAGEQVTSTKTKVGTTPTRHPKPAEIFDFQSGRVVHSLQAIMDAEQATKNMTIQSNTYRRSLSAIQVEEQAIQELEELYKVKEATDETIIIRTVPGKTVSKPVWGRK